MYTLIPLVLAVVIGLLGGLTVAGASGARV